MSIQRTVCKYIEQRQNGVVHATGYWSGVRLNENDECRTGMLIVKNQEGAD